MESCLFCKIAAGQVPADSVYADDLLVAFMDLHPVNPGHLLVIPKAHHDDFASTPADTLAALASAAQRLAKALMRETGATGFNIGINNGADAGQVINHVHFHVIPRHKNDGHVHWHGREYQPGEMAALAEKIRAALKA